MVIVTGSILAREGTVQQLLDLSLAHVARSRAEPGCIAHAVHRDAENPLRLVFFEEWADDAALATHFARPQSGEFVRQAAVLASARPAIRIFSAVETGFPGAGTGK